MNVTLEELLHAINILGDDRDVTVDGIDSIAVVPPVKLTPAGRTHFQQALTANVVVEYGEYGHQDTYVSDDDEKIDEMAWDFLKSLAGNCYEGGYNAWFEGEDAELV